MARNLAAASRDKETETKESGEDERVNNRSRNKQRTPTGESLARDESDMPQACDAHLIKHIQSKNT